MPQPITILHLSDIQFGRNHRFGRLSLLQSDDSLDTLLSRLQQDLDGIKEGQGICPDLLVVTGDLAEWGTKRELDDVHAFLERMAMLLGLTKDRILVVPGNHDINRKLCQAYFLECEASDETPREPFWPKLRFYEQFFEKFYSGIPGIRFTCDEPWSFFEIPALKLVVAGLNSAMKESHRDEDHYGWVGERQLRWFSGKLRPYKERGWLRIGLVHHNVMRRAMDDEENLRDTDDLRRILGEDINLLLHGHTHEGRLEWLGPKLPILSTGSAAVIRDARPAEVPNQYQIVRAYSDRLWYGARAYAPDQKRWIGDTRASRDGNKWFHEEQVLFERVDGTFGQDTPPKFIHLEHLATTVESYRNYVEKTFRAQTLHNLSSQGEDQDIPGGLALLEIFIPQAVRLSPPPKDLPSTMAWGTDADDGSVVGVDHRASGWGDSPSIPIEQAVTDPKQPWVLLLGAPGAGKTALTRWLCLKLCTPGESLPHLSSELVPVRVEMRRFDERYRAAISEGRSYDFFEYLDQEHMERTLAFRGKVIRDLAERGRLLWLFDGMDEVPDITSRQRYAEMIAGLSATGNSRGVITSRIVGARPILPCLQASGASVYTLLDFDEARIREFIERWHEKAFPGEPEIASVRRERLLRTIADSASVRDLCRNPLLLTLIALLNRGGELPRRRHLLYRRAVELMAAQWEANKQLPWKDSTRFELEDKIEFLRELAWLMQFELLGGTRNLIRQQNLSDFAIGFFRKRYGKEPEDARRYAEALIGHLRERNYILALIGGEFFGFVHKTFLEYLAAEAVRSRFAGRQVDLDWISELFRRRWSNDAWREVLMLVCGMLEEDHQENVMKVLQDALHDVSLTNYDSENFLAFATECLAEVRQLDQEPLRTFMVRLAELIQYESEARFSDRIAIDELAESIGMIGSRWPERERWKDWAMRAERWKRSSDLRLAENQFLLSVSPIEQHQALVVGLLDGEGDWWNISNTLAAARLSKENLDAFIEGCWGEVLQCAVGRHCLEVPSEHPASSLAAKALLVLEQLRVKSSSPFIKNRAAIILIQQIDMIGEIAAKSAFETLVNNIREQAVDAGEMREGIYAIGNLALGRLDYLERLIDLATSTSNKTVRQGAAHFLLQTERAAEMAQVISGWLESDSDEEFLQNVVMEFRNFSRQNSEIYKILKRLGESTANQHLRSMVVAACELVERLRVELPTKTDAVLAGLEDPSASDAMRFRLAWMLKDRTLSTEGAAVFQRVVRQMAASGSSPRVRLNVTYLMDRNPSFSNDERCAVLQDLASACPEEDIRFEAALKLGTAGKPYIEALARESSKEENRLDAQKAVRSLELRVALMSVGRG